MSRKDHWCMVMRGIGRRGPEVRLETGEDGTIWTLFYGTLGCPVVYCPFCGVELGVPLDSTLLCREPVRNQKCERASGHIGNHRAKWS